MEAPKRVLQQSTGTAENGPSRPRIGSPLRLTLVGKNQSHLPGQHDDEEHEAEKDREAPADAVGAKVARLPPIKMRSWTRTASWS